MTRPPLEIGELVTKVIGRAVEGSETLCRFIAVATLSLAGTLLEALRLGLVCDIRRVKESLIHKMEAEADEKAAEAQRKLAEAAEAANRATLHKRRDAIATAERRKLEAEVAKTEAEVEVLRKDAETRRLQAIAEAKVRWLEAVSKLRQEGGDMFLSKENLKGVFRLGLPLASPEPEKDKTE